MEDEVARDDVSRANSNKRGKKRVKPSQRVNKKQRNLESGETVVQSPHFAANKVENETLAIESPEHPKTPKASNVL